MLRTFIAFVGIFCVYSTLAQAQDMTWLNGITGQSILLLDAVVPALAVLSFAVFVWGVIVFIATVADDTKREEGKKKMLWGLVALFVFLSVWGLVQLLQRMFDVATPPAPTAPKATLST